MPGKPTKPVTATFPVYAERGACCDHPQSEHIGIREGVLTGKMVPCRICERTDHPCDGWVGSWG